MSKIITIQIIDTDTNTKWDTVRQYALDEDQSEFTLADYQKMIDESVERFQDYLSEQVCREHKPLLPLHRGDDGRLTLNVMKKVADTRIRAALATGGILNPISINR